MMIPYVYNPEDINLEQLRANFSAWQHWAEGRTATPIPPRHGFSKGLAIKQYQSLQLQNQFEHLSEQELNPQQQTPQWLKKYLVLLHRRELSGKDELESRLRAKLRDSMEQFDWNIRVLEEIVAANKALRNFAPFVAQAHRELRKLYERAIMENHQLSTHLLKAYDEISEGNRVLRSLLGKYRGKTPAQKRPSPYGNSRISWSYYDYNMQ
ncbi:hypothetical protein O0L34_g10743 [Tuta absoluta]|nr:hypothetical protein O0L34_g10743 [Tuta absoluta]